MSPPVATHPLPAPSGSPARPPHAAPLAPAQALAPWVRNADASLVMAQGLPCIVPDRPAQIADAQRSWVSCLWSGAIGYAVDEWAGQAPQRMRLPLLAAGYVGLHTVAALAKLGPWPRAVQLGSLPLSTTLRSRAQRDTLRRAASDLRTLWPKRPTAVRNIDAADEDLRITLQAQGFTALPARVVYWLDAPRALRASHTKRDLSLLRKGGLIELPDAAFDSAALIDQALALYTQVYRAKHGPRNPDYTAHFLRWARAAGVLQLVGLAQTEAGGEPRLVAFAALHRVGDVLSVPLLGYDTTADSRLGLYRQLVAWLINHAVTQELRFNFSSGAGDFKRKRGFAPHLEHTLIAPPLRGWSAASDAAFIALAARASRSLDAEALMDLGA
jgi:hypothetical protein